VWRLSLAGMDQTSQEHQQRGPGGFQRGIGAPRQATFAFELERHAVQHVGGFIVGKIGALCHGKRDYGIAARR
jgi:hypothetical protein